MPAPTRFRFSGFVVSRRSRQVLCEGRVLPLIPRYFDLLVLLIEQRQTAVSRREIFDRVWGDVIVSDGSLSQAIRTLRRTLGDDSREPVFIRTVSRHGYCFVFPEVVEEPDAPAAPVAAAVLPEVQPAAPSPSAAPAPPPFDELVDRLMRPTAEDDEEERREAAEQLHQRGTAMAIERVIARPGHAGALAMLRDARWDVPGAGPVRLLGRPEGLQAALALIRLRARHARRLAGRRTAGAIFAAAVVGACCGVVGGLALSVMPDSGTPLTAIPVLVLLGVIAGSLGAAGIGGGISAAEALARSSRGLAIVASGAAGGCLAGGVAYLGVRWTLEGLFGLRLDAISGPLEGMILGAAAGLGYAVSTERPGGGGMATPSGRARLWTAVAAGVCCGIAGAALAAMGRPLVGGMVNAIAQQSLGSQMVLTPLGYLVGEQSFGPATRMLIAALESAFFGCGLTWGLTRRPAPRP